ncbi:MAG: hypothetical protein R2701_08100 [Acidimicrobiales bacterium]
MSADPTPEPTTSNEAGADESFDAVGIIARASVYGALIVFALIVAVCLVTGQEWVDALAIAAMPALFAGPLAAGLIVMTKLHHYEELHGALH